MEATGIFEGVKRLGKKVIKSYSELGARLDVAPRKIPVEEITDSEVAKVILKWMGNPANERLGAGKWDNPFDITYILTYEGYTVLSNNTDFFKKYPEAYQATRRALLKLSNQGALIMEAIEKPNSHNETLFYKVENEKVLRQISQRQNMSPQQASTPAA